MNKGFLSLVAVTVFSGAAVVTAACSSSSSTGTSSGGTSSGTSGESSSGASGASGSSGTSGTSGSSGTSGTSGTSGASGDGGSGGFGTPCTTVGSDPACTGTYNLCEADGPSTICTKACSSGGMGGLPSADCPMPPTTGLCTPKSFCK
ncbi:MAG TPA: hypothetical protein VIF62_09675 [Labilithrix sp.]